MAKGAKLTQADLMIWTMTHPNGTKTFYLLEREPFETEGLKKAVHRTGSSGDAVFKFLHLAEAELAKWPAPEVEAPAEAAAETAEEAPAEA
ncbi:MAG TPA: hypothetical protein VK191_14655 [Symbiobacteriaceae bacterium]|nr:hypothetical protein [Symbiobacteriaceae bacterium]